MFAHVSTMSSHQRRAGIVKWMRPSPTSTTRIDACSGVVIEPPSLDVSVAVERRGNGERIPRTVRPPTLLSGDDAVAGGLGRERQRHGDLAVVAEHDEVPVVEASQMLSRRVRSADQFGDLGRRRRVPRLGDRPVHVTPEFEIVHACSVGGTKTQNGTPCGVPVPRFLWS